MLHRHEKKLQKSSASTTHLRDETLDCIELVKRMQSKIKILRISFLCNYILFNTRRRLFACISYYLKITVYFFIL